MAQKTNTDFQGRRFSVAKIKTHEKPTVETNREILRIVNKRRPFCLDDFVSQTFIPKLKRGR